MLISPQYLALQKDLYARTGDYGRSGNRWLVQVMKLADLIKAKTILDYGCGRGSLVYSLLAADYDAKGYDPAFPEKAAPPDPADLVVCTDVMEHIEPECLASVIAHMRSVTTQVLLLSVSLRLAGKRLRDGRNAHLIVQPAFWWQKKMSEYFKIDRVIPTDPLEWTAELIPGERT